MKRMTWRAAAAGLAALVWSAGAMAQAPQTELGQAMEKIGDSFKTLARGMRAPDLADVSGFAADVKVIKENAVKAKALVPELAEEAGAGKAAMVEAYQKSMTEFIAVVMALEKAVAANDVAGARTLVGKLNEARKQGHEKYKKPEE